MDFFIGAAHAADAARPAAPGYAELAMIAGFILIFYFLIIRPQNKRAKEHRDMVTALQKGDEVVTSGGVLGKISKLSDDFLVVNISEGVEVKCQKSAVSAVLPKGTIKAIG